MKFAVGDLVIYGETGVCRVVDIVEKEFLEVVQQCYKLQPIYQSCVIFTPAEGGNVFMRKIITSEEAEGIISGLKTREPAVYNARSSRELSDIYDKIIKQHDCDALALLMRSIYEKRQKLIAQKKKLSAIDERYMKKAEDLLFGEIAAALGIEKRDVAERIR